MPNLTMDSLDYSFLIIDSKTGLGLEKCQQCQQAPRSCARLQEVAQHWLDRPCPIWDTRLDSWRLNRVNNNNNNILYQYIMNETRVYSKTIKLRKYHFWQNLA